MSPSRQGPRRGLAFLALLPALVLTAVSAPAVSAEDTSALGFTFSPIGRILGPEETGHVPGPMTGTADVSAVETPSGDIRLYYWEMDGTMANTIVSAVSQDGTTFQRETGIRLRGAAPFVYPLPGGGYRMYYTGDAGVLSATSTDGLTFTADPGVRLAKDVFHEQLDYHLGCSAIVPLAGGNYRMYCSQAVTYEVFQGAKIFEWAVYSATSRDLLQWTPDPGVRIGPGAPIVSKDANHPTVLVSAPTGAVALLYYRAQGPGPDEPKPPPGPGHNREFVATSADGLTFDTEAWTGLYGTEASAVRRASGDMLLYYGNMTPSTGSIISVATVMQDAPATCTVPAVARMKLAVAKAAIEAAGCAVGPVTSAYSAKVPRGQVLRQSPSAGTEVAAGTAVALVLSKGRRR